MQKSTLTRLILCVMFSTPFLLLSASYHALPPELPMLRIWIGHGTRFAARSVFTVFRVPLMNLTHGLLASIMLSRARDFENAERHVAYSNLFLTLLFAIAFKSNFEALELSVPAAPGLLAPYARWLGFATLISVVAGIALALMRGRKAPLPWPELRLTIRDRFLLVGLFAVYVAVVILSTLVSHRA